MKIEQFLALSEPEKEELIWEQGDFWATHFNDDMIFDTYKLFDFFVVFSNELHKNEMAKITTYLHQDELPDKILHKSY